MKYCVWIFVVLLSTLMCEAQIVQHTKTRDGGRLLQFKENLRFGANERDDLYLWSGQVVVAADSQGRIYVADGRGNRLLRFDQNGKSPELLGGPGTGPGEFQALYSVQVLADDRIMAMELAPGVLPSFNWFDAQGNFVRKERFTSPQLIPTFPVFAPNGEHYAGSFLSMNMQEGAMELFTGLASKQEALQRFSLSTQAYNPSFFASPEGLAQFIAEYTYGLMAKLGSATMDREGNLYTAPADGYQITRWNADYSDADRVFERNYKPKVSTDAHAASMIDAVTEQFMVGPLADMVSPAFIQRVKASKEFPISKKPIFGLMVTDKGHLLAVHDVDGETGRQLVDVFEEDGTFLGQLESDQYAFLAQGTNQPRMVFVNGQAYTVCQDEDGEQHVVRYNYLPTTPNR